jgi:hypothetical protein
VNEPLGVRTVVPARAAVLVARSLMDNRYRHAVIVEQYVAHDLAEASGWSARRRRTYASDEEEELTLKKPLEIPIFVEHASDFLGGDILHERSHG